MKRSRIPTEAERLAKYFYQLRVMFPNPPKDWELNAKPCKWAKIIEERKNNPDVSGE
jgi:hypothetical protein